MTRAPASVRVATVLNTLDLLALDEAAKREDVCRSTYLRKLIRSRLREDRATKQEPTTCS